MSILTKINIYRQSCCFVANSIIRHAYPIKVYNNYKINNPANCLNLPSQALLRYMHSTEHSEAVPCKIGCASGFWGDTPTAVRQLLRSSKLDFLVLDYLSEITMSLLTAAKAKDPQLGYAPDFVLHAIGPHLKQIKLQGVKVISNAGGINPEACAIALHAAATKAGADIKVGIVTGDDLMPQLSSLAGIPDLVTGELLPHNVNSINAYTGAGAIIRALELGADIVVTGRCADSSLTLAAAAYHHEWSLSSLHEVAGGSLAGHLLECGAQVTGGNHTDWRKVTGWHDMGFPVASVYPSGSCNISKAPGSGGLLSRGAVCEQLLYEIGDPRCYLLPDLALDLTHVTVGEAGVASEDGFGDLAVEVRGAVGLLPTDTYKVGATHLSGYKTTAVCILGGPDAALKARITAEATLERVNRLLRGAGMTPITRYHIQALGDEESYGPHRRPVNSREAVLWLSVLHPDKRALEVFGRELAAAGTGGVPGLMSLVGGRPTVTPVLKLHSSLVKKKDVPLRVTMGDHSEEYCETGDGVPYSSYCLPHQPTSDLSALPTGNCTYRLEDVALTRSGDKGDSCNIGVVARRATLLPLIQARLTAAAVEEYFSHVLEKPGGVARYEVPGIAGLNFVLSHSLGGGGVASLRPDPQGKALGQMLLDFPLTDMPDLDTLK